MHCFSIYGVINIKREQAGNFGISNVERNYMNRNSDQQHLQKHIRRQAIGNFAINAILNAGIVYGIMGSRKTIPFSGGDGFAADLLITAIVLSAIVSAVVMWTGRKQGRNGKLAWLSTDEMGLSRGLPQSPLKATLLFTIAGMLVAAISLVLLSLLSVDNLSLAAYAGLKGAWTGAWAALLVSLALRHGLRVPPENLQK
ncbi:hypothetical protein OAB15_05105 [Porticoccaceae bacterium]|nr:hypothetical protein [Porticoccaceae bacterium]